MKNIKNLALVAGMAFSGCGEDSTQVSGLEDQCTSDFDCKGDRVCESTYEGGQEVRTCVSPNGYVPETPSTEEEVRLEDTTCEGSPLNGMYVRGLPGCRFHSLEPGDPETCKMQVSFYGDGSVADLHYNSDGQLWFDYSPEVYGTYGYQTDYLYRLTRSFDKKEVNYGIETDGHGEFTCDMAGNMTPSTIEKLWRKYQCVLQNNPDVYGLRMEFIEGRYQGETMVCLNITNLNRIQVSNTLISSDDSCLAYDEAIKAECVQE
ncbi:MAG: hypothetical protein Q8Q01_03050 [archaeon]|nr:hypothetical protein [archaeon]